MPGAGKAERGRGTKRDGGAMRDLWRSAYRQSIKKRVGGGGDIEATRRRLLGRPCDGGGVVSGGNPPLPRRRRDGQGEGGIVRQSEAAIGRGGGIPVWCVFV